MPQNESDDKIHCEGIEHGGLNGYHAESEGLKAMQGEVKKLKDEYRVLIIKAELVTQRLYEAMRRDLNAPKWPEIKIRFDSIDKIAETEIKLNQAELRIKELSKSTKGYKKLEPAA